jgi:hypothetical protein
MTKVKYSMPIDHINILIENQQRVLDRQVSTSLNSDLLNITGWKEMLFENLTDMELPENVSVVALKSAKDKFKTKSRGELEVRVRPISFVVSGSLKETIEYYMDRVATQCINSGEGYEEIVMCILIPIFKIDSISISRHLMSPHNKAIYGDYYIIPKEKL